jgi:hypothetical protein
MPWTFFGGLARILVDVRSASAIADRGTVKYPAVRALPTIEISREDVVETGGADAIQKVQPGVTRGWSSVVLQRHGDAVARKLSKGLTYYGLGSLDVNV